MTLAILTNRTTVNGEIQSFTYDNCNRKIGMSWSNSADSASYYYDDSKLCTAQKSKFHRNPRL